MTQSTPRNIKDYYIINDSDTNANVIIDYLKKLGYTYTIETTAKVASIRNKGLFHINENNEIVLKYPITDDIKLSNTCSLESFKLYFPIRTVGAESEDYIKDIINNIDKLKLELAKEEDLLFNKVYNIIQDDINNISSIEDKYILVSKIEKMIPIYCYAKCELIKLVNGYIIS